MFVTLKLTNAGIPKFMGNKKSRLMIRHCAALPLHSVVSPWLTVQGTFDLAATPPMFEDLVFNVLVNLCNL
jgi:hypothetical protein